MLHTTSVRAARGLATPSVPQLRTIAHRSSRVVRLCPPAKSTVRVSSRSGICESSNNIPRRHASSTTPYSTASDPAEVEAMQCLEQGTQKLEEGDVQGAKELYKRSVEIKRNASSLFNLGVTHYHLSTPDFCLYRFKMHVRAISPRARMHTQVRGSSPAAPVADMCIPTDLASAYIISPVSRPDLALHHLQHFWKPVRDRNDSLLFLKLSHPTWAAGQLEEALEYYKRSKENGVDRAAIHIRNVSAKILGKQMQAAEAEDKSKKSDS
ncbi:hypothetical protein J3R82DRAFT_2407, partial [Butyriboletus roseoflavus]